MFGRKKSRKIKAGRSAQPARAKTVETVSFDDAEDAEVADILEARRRAQEPEEVYILVDEDGNEVEVPASELDQYEIVEEEDVEETLTADGAAAGREPAEGAAEAGRHDEDDEEASDDPEAFEGGDAPGGEDADTSTGEGDDIYRAAADIPAEDLFDQDEEDTPGEGRAGADAEAAEEADESERSEKTDGGERYVYVDEDGNEIELTEEELAEYEVVEEEADEPEDDAVYVYVDEDGNEIEVSADELDQYEVVEETQEESDRKRGRETYDKFQKATDDVNDIARSGISTARELKDAHDDIKGTFDDIKDLFSDFKK